jgi:hypothetical protein
MKTKVKSICIFCLEEHKRKQPALCLAKSRIMRHYLEQGLQMWQILAAVHSGLLPLEALALAEVEAEKTKRKRGTMKKS